MRPIAHSNSKLLISSADALGTNGCARTRAPCPGQRADGLVTLCLRALDVDRGQNGEDVRLNSTDEHLDTVDDKKNRAERNGRNQTSCVGKGDLLDKRLGKERDHQGEGAHDDVAREHVAEQTHRKGDGSQEGRDDLDDPDQDVQRESDTRGGQALDVADGTMGLHAAGDEVNERHQRKGGRHGDGARAGLHARDNADDVVHQDEEEQGGQEREVLLPALGQDAFANILLDELHDILHAVSELAMGHEREALYKREHDHEQQNGRDDEPERVLGHARHEIAHHGDGAELGDHVVDLSWQLVKCFQGSTFL